MEARALTPILTQTIPSHALHGAKPMYLGRQILAEYYGCDAEVLHDNQRIEELMLQAARQANMTIVESVFHHFNPHGVSGAVIIAESHITIHTWPEYRYAAVDLFTCGDEGDPQAAFSYLLEGLGANYHSVSEMKRGYLPVIEREALLAR
jgi:S-adenosylmethionine decarboxylase